MLFSCEQLSKATSKSEPYNVLTNFPALIRMTHKQDG